MKKSLKIYSRWFALLLLFLLWGGGLSADAAERAWAKYSGENLTFYYGEKSTLGSGEYALKEGSKAPGWGKYKNNITKVVFDPSFAKARPKSCYRWFYYFTKLTEIEGISNLNTSEVTDMAYMFCCCSKLTTLDVSKFNTEKVTYMYSMFNGCSQLTTLDVSKFNTANVTNMESMFQECSQLTTLDVSEFNTANVTDMGYMFYGCSQLQVIYASDKFVVNEGADDTSMFNGCTCLKGDIDFQAAYIDKTYAKVDGGYFTDKLYTRPWAQYADGTLTFRYGYKKDLGSGEYALNEGNSPPGWGAYKNNITKVAFDPSFAKARPKSCYKWFYSFTKLKEIEGISNLNTSEVTTMGSMFYRCSQLTTLDVSGFNTANVTNMESMFQECSQLTTLDVSEFNTENVTNMGSMFYGCSQLTTLDVSKFNTEKVTDMGSMFNGCSQLTTLGVSKFNTANVKDMGYMFSSCSQLTTLDVSKFNTENVTNMWYMFNGCSQLTTLDVSKFNTENVKDMESMFRYCSQLTTLDVSGFNTANVINMRYMFKGCSQLTTLDVSGFNTEKVTNMWSMFDGCSQLTTLDVSEFNTENVTDMWGMFYDCSQLTTLDVSGFNTANVTDMGSMFYGCSQLQVIYASDKFVVKDGVTDNNMFYDCTSLKGDIDFQAAYIDKTYAKVDGGYFTDKLYTRPWAQYADGTLTFRYGYKKDLGSGEYELKEGGRTPGWQDIASNITRVVFDPSFAKARPKSCYQWFRSFTKLTEIEGISNLNTSEVTNMESMFYNCSQLTTLDVSGFNTANVIKMNSMFNGCSQLTTLDVSGFNTANVADMEFMFRDCSQLQVIYASDKFVVNDGVTDNSMFYGCTSLKGDIDFQAAYIDKTYAKVDGGYFTDKLYTRPWAQYADGTLTFRYGYKKDLGSGEYALNEGGNARGWLAYDDNITKVVFDPSFAKARPKSCYKWFYYLTKLTEIEGISNFNTSEVTDMESMFHKCSQLTTLDVSGFNTANVTDMGSMFGGCSQLTTLNVSNFNTENVTNMRYMFDGCSQLTTLDVSNFNTENVTNMKGMFNGCSQLTTLDVSNFNTENVTDMWYMFNGCSQLTTLDVSKFNTANVTDMRSMFYYCSQLTTLDVSGFNTANVTDMKSMFEKCSQLTTLDVSGFNTANVTDMWSMFNGCSQLTTLDVSGFNTANVTDMGSMFYGCNKLQYIYLGAGFSTDNVTSYRSMFYDCPATLYCLPDCYVGLRNNSVLADLRKKVKPYVPINAQAEYGTLCVPIGSKLTEGTFMGFDKLYTVKNADTDNATVTLTQATEIEAGVPYVYHRSIAEDAPAIIAFESDDDASIANAPKNESSMLKGTFESIIAPGDSYILQVDGMFHPVASGNSTLPVGAYRAYLDPNSLGSETMLSKSLHIVFGGNATAIDSIFNMNDEPKIYFDLSGRKIARPQRGHTYILKGKKIKL